MNDEDNEEIIAESKIFNVVSNLTPDDNIPGLHLTVEGPADVNIKFSGIMLLEDHSKNGIVAIFKEWNVCKKTIVDPLFKISKWKAFWLKLFRKTPKSDIKNIKTINSMHLEDGYHVFSVKLHNLKMINEIFPLKLWITRK